LISEILFAGIIGFFVVLGLQIAFDWYIYINLLGAQELRWEGAVPVALIVAVGFAWARGLHRRQKISREHKLAALRQLNYEIRDSLELISSLEFPPSAHNARAILEQCSSHVTWVLDTMLPEVNLDCKTAVLSKRLENLKKLWYTQYEKDRHPL
jgi:hypothetical protein